MKLIRVSPECCDKCLSTCLEFRLKIEGCAIRGYDIDFNITQVCTEYHKNQTKITPPVPRKAVITKMPAIPEVEEQITPVVTKIGPYAIKKTGVQKLIVNPKWSLKRVEMGVQVCTEYHKNQTKITPPVPRKAVITKMPAIPEVEEQITPVVTKIGPYAIKKTGVQKLIVNPKWSLKRVEMGVQVQLAKNGSTLAGTSVLSPFLHIGSMIALAAMIYKKSAVQLFERHLCLYILTFGFVCAKITNQLVLAHMTKSEMYLYDTAFISPALLFLDQMF
ncbi:hypothetical protein DUI87_03471 [Hirundo rustica rustica]|uniref:Uncharacterized protein n=1 Tax=Hirundo rustica rustica TaxID=333673 RepID=A0A3M0L3B9_HIRRU|nr:hypothetical protein DUI87_03471 [Hirundo rustica rustica]